MVLLHRQVSHGQMDRSRDQMDMPCTTSSCNSIGRMDLAAEQTNNKRRIVRYESSDDTSTVGTGSRDTARELSRKASIR